MKPHVQLRVLSECPDGTRFYSRNTCNPYTLITTNKSGQILAHRGHEFNKYAVKSWGWSRKAMGWVVV